MKKDWKRILTIFLVCVILMPNVGVLPLSASPPVRQLVDISTLAPGVSATANGSETTTLTPDKIYDGILDYAGKTTRWASTVGINTKWVMLNLGASKEFSQVIIDWERKNATDYYIEISTDGNVFTDRQTFTAAPADYRQTISYASPVTAQYIRLTITNFLPTGEDRNGTNISWETVSLFAMEIYAYAPGAVATINQSKIDLTQSALLDVTAKNFANPSYQWYVNTTNSTAGGTAIPGANSDTYSFSPSNDQLYYFYCIVTGSEGTATSNTVALTVTVVNPSYEIYPIPQYTKSLGGTLTITPEVNLVIESGIDEATVTFAKKILDEHSIGYTVSNAVVSDKTNVMIGINGSLLTVDTYVNANVQYNKALFAKQDVFDKYLLAINNEAPAGLIAILGEHTDASFYGLETLALILDQAANNIVEMCCYEDYATMKLRGFIEGYYGNPWSYDNRKSLMDLGGRFKMNGYIYAPKDEPYHNSQWRTLYPTAELAKVKELVDKGIETKCRFIWAIHPAMSNAITFGTNYSTDLNVLLTKFNQLYSIGVRDFAVCVDDVSLGTAATTGANHLMLMNDINAWAIAKGDIKTLAFVPTIYNRGSVGSNVAYLNVVSDMPASVEIMWTGDAVFGKATKAAFEYVNPIIKRKGFMWLNWPVTDNARGKTSLGKGECLETGNDQMIGIVSNPMENAELSKVSLFAIADFSWNAHAFDADQSWRDSFKYLAPEVADAYLAVANHINYVNLGVSESENIAADLTAFEAAVTSGAPLDAIGGRLVAEFDKVYNGTEEILQHGNPELVKEIYPWAKCLGHLVLAAKGAVVSAMGLKSGNNWDALRNAVLMVSNLAKSKQFSTTSLNSSYQVSAGIKRLAPFTERMVNMIRPKVEALLPVEGSETPVVYTNVAALKATPVTKSGSNVLIENRTGITLGPGEYLGIDLTRIESIYNFFMNVSAAGLTLQVSPNSFEWQDITPPGINLKGRYIRAINNTAVSINFDLTMLSVTMIGGAITKPNVTNNYSSGVYSGSLNNLIDGDVSTNCWMNGYQSNGAYIRLDYGGLIDIDSITIVQTSSEGDYFRTGYLQVSTDASNWTTVYTFTNGTLAQNFPDLYGNTTITNPPAYRSRTVGDIGRQARYVQLISNASSNVAWLRFQEFIVNSPTVTFNYTSTNANYTSGVYEGHPYNLVDNNKATRLWMAEPQNSGKYLKIDMGKSTYVDSLSVIEADGEGDYFRSGYLQVSEDAGTWETVYTFANGTLAANFPDLSGSFRSRTVTGIGKQVRYIQLISNLNPSGGNWLRLQGIDINGGAMTAGLDGFEKRLTDGKLDTNYTPGAASSSFVYMISQDVNNLSCIGVMQQPDAPSSAKVEIRTADGWKYVGDLNGFYTDFDVSREDFVYEMRFTYAAGDTPTLVYMFKTRINEEPFIVPRMFKVVFDKGNGDTIEKDCIEGSYVTAPEVSKLAYLFDGWYDGQEKWDFSEQVMKDIVLKAKWIPGPTPVFTGIDGKQIDPLSSDKVNVSFAYENTSDAGISLDMIVAVYNEKNRMVYVKQDSVPIEAGGIGDFHVLLEMPENAAGNLAGDGYSISVFMWDSVTYVPIMAKFSW